MVFFDLNRCETDFSLAVPRRQYAPAIVAAGEPWRKYPLATTRSTPDVEPAPGNTVPHSILVLETDAGVRWSIEKGLSRSGYSVQCISSLSEALDRLHTDPPDVVVMELLPEAGLTLDALSSIAVSPNAPQLVCVSVDSNPHIIVECMRRGAADFLPKPFSLAELRGAVNRAIERNGRGPGTSAAVKGAREESLLIGVSQPMKDLRRVVRQAAQTDLNCLVRGESGVGKDIIARELHHLSRRRDKPFVKVNCTALPENLLESELFGYEKGAFTGADRSKPGRFSLANGGIIFLDEIGDMHPMVQAKILQVIEHKEFTKLGGGAPVRVDVQIVAATNANLEEKIATGGFRDDLFFRLNEVYIWAPPLSERREDIPLLVHHFLTKHSQYAARLPEVSAEDINALSNYSWPGNVRELESTIKRWVALGKTTMELLHRPHTTHSTDPPMAASAAEPRTVEIDRPPRRVPEPEEVRRALEQHKWNRRNAAEALGIGYSAIRRYIDKYGLDRR